MADDEEMGQVVAVEDVPVPGAEIVVREHSAGVTLFGSDNPVTVLARATEVADALAEVIEKQKLYSTISGKKHIKVEGWTLLGSMLGVFPEIEWTRQTTDSKGADAWEARCIARTRDGAIVGAREAMCSKSEQRWKSADDYAIRSMAQTRSISGALASPLRFVVVLAGFEGTPESEMPANGGVAEEERRQENAGRESSVPRTGAQVKERLVALLGEDEAAVWGAQAREYAEGRTLSPTALQRLAGVVVDLEEKKTDFLEFPAEDAREKIQQVFAVRFDGAVFPGPAWAMSGTEAEAGAPSKFEVLGDG